MGGLANRTDWFGTTLLDIVDTALQGYNPETGKFEESRLPADWERTPRTDAVARGEIWDGVRKGTDEWKAREAERQAQADKQASEANVALGPVSAIQHQTESVTSEQTATTRASQAMMQKSRRGSVYSNILTSPLGTAGLGVVTTAGAKLGNGSIS